MTLNIRTFKPNTLSLFVEGQGCLAPGSGIPRLSDPAPDGGCSLSLSATQLRREAPVARAQAPVDHALSILLTCTELSLHLPPVSFRVCFRAELGS